MTEFWDKYADELIGEAEAAAVEGLARCTFGKLQATNRYVKWVEGTPIEIDLDEFRILVGDKATRRQAMLEMTFTINPREFNPSLEWDYERKVRVGGPDWRKTLVPSIEAIYGKDSMKKDRGKTLSQLIGSYVEVHDVPQQPVKGDKHINKATGDPYSTIKIARVFPDRESCYEAYVARFGEPGQQGGGVEELPPVPEGYATVEEWEAMHEEIVGFLKRRLDKGTPAVEAIQAAAGEYGVNEGYIQPLADGIVPL